MKEKAKNNPENHRFLDEAGDTSFIGKGRKNILGQAGVSKCFIIGMVKFKEPLNEVRKKVLKLQEEITTNPFFETPSLLKKKKSESGYYLHATDDIPEVRLKVFELITTFKCSFEAVVGTKEMERYEFTHKGKEEYFYADMLSHLLKNKLSKAEKLIFHISQRGKSTKNNNLELSYKKAVQRFHRKGGEMHEENKIVFDVNVPTSEPLLNIADYFCWAVQRVFEKGEIRYYNLLKKQISLVVDVYDSSRYNNNKNYYKQGNPLTTANKIEDLTFEEGQKK